MRRPLGLRLGPPRGWAPVRLGAAVAMLLLALAPPAAAQGAGPVVGVVTAGGAPVANAWVRATPVTARGDWAGRAALATTDAEGRFAITGLAVGRVKVLVRAPAQSGWAATWWPQAFTFADAGALDVGAAGARADVVLAPGGRVSGIVVSADSGEPVMGGQVTAHVATPAGTEEVGTPGLARRPGEFVIEDLPPLPTLLRADPPAGTNLLAQWFDGAGFAGGATAVDGAARTGGVRIALRSGAEVSGTVRDDSGAPVAGAQVTLTFCPGLCPLMATTAQDGSYRIGSIPPGPRLMLHARAPGSGLLEGWHRAPGQSREARLDLVAGDSWTDADITLVRGAFLAVRVVDDTTGEPVPDVSAELVSVANPILGFLPGSRDRLMVRSGSAMTPGAPATGDEANPAATDAGPAAPGAGPPAGSSLRSGRFVVGPVPPGEYRLVLYPGYGNPRYVPTTWGAPTGIDADGTIRLEPEQRAEVVVPLVPVGSPDEPDAAPRPAAPQGQEEACAGASGAAGAGAADAGVGGAGGRRAGADPDWPGLAPGVLGAPPAWASAG